MLRRVCEHLGIPDPAAFGAVLTAQLLNGVGYGMIFPVAAFYGEKAGLGPALITLLVAAHPLARLVSAPLWGRLADRVGRRPVLLTGIALQAAGHLVFGLSGNALGLGLGRALTGLGAADAVAAAAITGDLTPVEHRARAFGLLRAASGLGTLGGPVLGGLLGLWDLRLPGLAAGLACLVNLVQVALRCPETRHTTTSAGGLLPPWAALGMAAIAAGAIGMAEAVAPLAAEHVLVPTLTLPAGWTPSQAGVLVTVGIILAWGVTTAIFDGALSARIVERLGERPALAFGLLAWAVAFSLTPPVYRIGVVPGAFAVMLTAIPVSITSVALVTWVSRRAGRDAQGRATGALTAAAAVGEFVGPASAGSFYERWYGLPYLVAAGCLALVALLVPTLPRSPSS